MRTLYHFPLCPFSRKVRIVLGEKNLEFSLHFEPVWKKRPEFLDLNPCGKVPVLIDHENQVLIDSYAICEYLDEVYPGHNLLGKAVAARAETRRLVAWFDDAFFQDATYKLLFEKVFKRYNDRGVPDSSVIRIANANIRHHFDYLTWLIERRHWLVGEVFSLADVAGAAHLSILDYLNHVPWDDYPQIKDWYARIKSRPSFRGLLTDQVPGLAAPAHYWDLDF
jgi:glutathione S-transferase